MYELVYTSARRGLKVGSRGFCTVAHTEGMPAGLIQLAESLSGYRNLYQPHDRNYEKNPVAFSHYLANTAGHSVSVLSRVAAYGTDYSGRTNKLAHHLLLTNADRSAAGPATVLSQDGLFANEWKEEPRQLPARPRLKIADASSFRADAWAAACGDAGWAGVLAQRHRDAPGKDTYLVFEAGMDLLALVREALALLPPDERWQVTFSTYFTGAPRHSTCHWRGCVKNADALRTARSKRDALIIDLTEPMPRASDGLLVAVARGEATPEWAVPPKPSAPALRRRPPLQRKAAQTPATPLPEPGSVKLKGAEPLKKKPIEIARRREDKVRRTPEKTSLGMGKAIGVAVGVIAIVVGSICIWHMGPSRENRVRGVPPPRPVPSEKPAPTAPRPPIVVETPEPTTTVTKVVVPEERTPPPEEMVVPPAPAAEDRPCDLLFRMTTFTGSDLPWRVALPQGESWETYAYEFIGIDGPFDVGNPVRDIDRLRNVVRGLTYHLEDVGLRAKVTSDGLTFEPTGSGTPQAAALVCVHVARPTRDSEATFWLNGLNVDARDVTDLDDGVAFSIANEGPVPLLVPCLERGTMRCQAGFRGTALRRDLPCEVSVDGDGLTLKVVVSNDNRERILAVIQYQARKEKSVAAPSPRATGRQAVWNRTQVAAALRKLQMQAGEDGVLTSVRRKVITRDLRELLIELCEAPLQGNASMYASALNAHRAMDALWQAVRSAMWEESSREDDAEEDFREPPALTASGIRKRSAERARFYRGMLLPSNRVLDDEAIRDILFADEWDALVAEKEGGDFGEDAAADIPVEAVELVVSDLHLYAPGATYQPVLTVRRTGVGAF